MRRFFGNQPQYAPAPAYYGHTQAAECQEYSDDAGYYDDYADYLDDDAVNTSPCPPQRNYVPQPQFRQAQGPTRMYEEEIVDYPEEPYEQEQIDYYPSQRVYQEHEAEPQYVDDDHMRYQDYQDPPHAPPHQHIPNPHRTAYDDDPGYPEGERNSLPHEPSSDRIRLRPVSDLPDVYRTMFKFGVFNAVQSTCFDPVLTTDENMVISAPTGSGKTVLFELAIIKMLNDMRSTGTSLKCVYMAPTKALCSERQRDWSAKFDPLGVKCCEMTGDTVLFGKGAWGDAKNATIIITTGEKWDSLTRNWRDHGQILSQIQLFLVDEVHILNETRGSTLEVVISRMKTRGTSVRFVMVSATVPNIQDIASWVGSARNRSEPAKVYEFGEEYRPCKLTRHVVGVPRQKNSNDFQFAKILDYKIFETLQTYSSGKPILVFVATRKGVFGTADQLKKDYEEAMKKKQTLPWVRPPRINYTFNDKRLEDWASYGIGVHHAGLTMDDRRAIEDLYMNRKLRIVVATSTLAVGVNLPAHTVVIKGVHIFQNNMSMEYSDLDIIQMLGRAGRPQFDKEGVAIILCEQDLENKYRALLQGTTVLESSLHLNLSEHLNSEIGLGTITNLQTAKGWLKNSFLFQRIQRNPNHYALGKNEDQTWEERMDDLVIQSVVKLKDSELITYEGEAPNIGQLQSTEYGDIMSKFYIRQTTMCLILKMPEKPTLREVLETISVADECGDSKLRTSEKAILSKINRHNDLRFTIKKVEKTSDKAFLLIQAILGGLPLSSSDFKSGDSQPQLEAFGIFKHIGRISKAVVEVAIARRHGAQLRHGLELSRCFAAKAWEDRPIVFRQIPKIGEKSINVLAEHGITSISKLRKENPIRIEALLNRRPPFGHEIIAAVQEFPHYSISIKELQVHPGGGDSPATVELLVECGVIEHSQSSNGKKGKIKSSTFTSVLTVTSDDDFIDFRRIPTRSIGNCKSFEVSAELTKPSQTVIVYISSENYAGVTVTQSYKPRLPPSAFPTLVTRPGSELDRMVEDLEADQDFWGMMDEGEPTSDEKPVAKNMHSKPPATKRPENKPPAPKKPSTAKTQNSAAQEQQSPDTRVRRRGDGKYDCNHNCKDKSKCRHLCCRDGLPAPPLGIRKRPSAGKNDPRSPATRQEKTTKKTPVKKAPTKAAQKEDRRLQDLDELHRNANVSENIGINHGKRIKVNSNPPLKLSPSPDIAPSPRSPLLEYKDIQDEDDELPDPLDILRTMPTKQSSDNYSDSELDALMMKIPSDDIPVASSASTNYSSSSKKRPAVCEESGDTKRAKLDGKLPSPGVSHPKVEQEPLFLEIPSSDEDEPIVVDSGPTSPRNAKRSPRRSTAPSSSYGSVKNEAPPTDDDYPTYDDPSAFDDSGYFEALAPSPVPFNDDDMPVDASSVTMHSSEYSQSQLAGAEAPAAQADDMEEFDAWLNSGAVEIV
ncbi:Sec63 Brl domain-containing protein [Schizophyllum amplum]|uniref:DNA 3'-5' helicase n=1 Tax=Schizophyllum amplum TaxID=97359 RepID=A0A550C3A7_9AGAR|nr:Sec63 Brl domain-containing protein [Auriculariopsis ampla]